jgi:PAS domain S-box-containing protein
MLADLGARLGSYWVSAIAACFAVGALVEDLASPTVVIGGRRYDRGSEAVITAVLCGVVALVALRGRLGVAAPLSALALVGVASFAAPAWVLDSGFLFLLVMLACGIAGYMAESWLDRAGLIVLVAAGSAAAWRNPDRGWGQWFSVVAFMSIAWVVGAMIRRPVVRAQADRASLRESEQRFRAFMDNGPVLTVILDSEDRVVFLGEPALRVLGVGAEVVGLHATELLPPEFIERYRPLFQGARDTGEVQTAVVPLPLPDGSVRDMQAYYFRVPGEPAGMVGGISLDVTESLASQRMLAAAAEEEAALRRVATLVAAEASDSDVFAVATEEVGRLLHAQTTNMVRFTAGLEAVVLGAWNEPGVASVPTDTTVVMDGDTVLTRVFRSSSPARMDSYDGIPGALADRLRALGVRSSVAAPILLQGHLWGAFTASTTLAEPMPVGAEQRIAHFADLVAHALANNEARGELAASRERIVEAADAARRRLARDLHDGAQQRLVALMITLRLARRQFPDHPEKVLQHIDGAIEELETAVEELRELAHGIHPAILTDHGLPAALRAMVVRSAVAVQVHCQVPDRLPPPVEAALYFVCSESLANMHKHGNASAATITLIADDEQISLDIIDDGRGGAAVRSGGGLEGMHDRIQALGGRFHLDSPAGGGTRIHLSMPRPATAPR